MDHSPIHRKNVIVPLLFRITIVQKDTWIIITILSQQIKQINSIEHKKISGMTILGQPGISVGSRTYRRNYTPVDSIN